MTIEEYEVILINWHRAKKKLDNIREATHEVEEHLSEMHRELTIQYMLDTHTVLTTEKEDTDARG